ncbi:MAG TPA: ABC transporter ATP-binding protein [Lachnospiraceae bacterium]|nr:ABC transporter ATP-binding protein [Lachnospiraceae bacterium]
MNVYKRLKQLLNQKQKRQVLLLIFMIFVSALLETLGVSIIVPLISAVVTPEKLLENETVQKIFTIFGVAITDKTFFVKLLLLCTMGIFLLKNIYLLFLYYIQARFVTKTEATTSIRLLNEYLNRPYEFYLNADVNAMFQTINKDIPHVFELLQEVMKLLTEIAVSMCLCTLLFVVDFKMSLSISVLLLLMVLFIVFVLKPKLGNLGQGRLKQQVLTMKWMQQGIFGIKDVKVAAKEKYFLGKFADAYTRLAGIIRKYTVFNNAPRLVIETVCIVGLLGYMFLCIVKGEDMSRLLPQLTAFALAAVRLMPSVNRISTHLSTIAYYEPSLNFVCDNLNIAELKDVEEKTSAEVMELKHSIELKEITYAYPNTDRKIFDRASMNIPVGQSVGVIGSSGAGKTTIIDVLLGLLQPKEGSICCDGKAILEDDISWLHNIGYIAQNIYMLDSTIRDNVAFGVDTKDMDEQRIWEVLREAQMEEYVRKLPEGLDTVIGDRGVRISGGQRQRIGIARALYHDPELLVFDEATSALDNETEAAIMEAINALKGRKTMVIIAHRLKTIESCDMIYRVENGKITRTILEET